MYRHLGNLIKYCTAQSENLQSTDKHPIQWDCSLYFISGIYQVYLFISIWHDNNHWSSCGVCHDWNVRWSFWPGSWYLPFDYHPGMPIINIFKVLTSPKNNFFPIIVVLINKCCMKTRYPLVDHFFLVSSLSCLILYW